MLARARLRELYFHGAYEKGCSVCCKLRLHLRCILLHTEVVAESSAARVHDGTIIWDTRVTLGYR